MSIKFKEWENRHCDAWHFGRRESCEHCQEMIKTYGEMPPADAMLDYLIGRGMVDIHKPAPTQKRKTHIRQSLRDLVFGRDEHKCKACGATVQLSCDHIVPESKGGPTTAENLQTLCMPCNRLKGAR
jgi:hypothetical protein